MASISIYREDIGDIGDRPRFSLDQLVDLWGDQAGEGIGKGKAILNYEF
jgi:hypothetical protein